MISAKIIGFFALEAIYFLVCHSALADHPRESVVTAIFKCLPICYLLCLCQTTGPKNAEHKRYRDEITVGLIFSILGDVCLVWRHSLFILGASSFAVAHLFYIRAFGLRPLGLLTGIYIFVSGAVVFMFFLPSLKFSLDFAIVPAYIALIFAMWWRAIIRWKMSPTWPALLANVGAFVFVASDFFLAVDKFVSKVPSAGLIIMLLYYGAQFLIAMSVCLYRPPASPYNDDRDEKRG